MDTLALDTSTILQLHRTYEICEMATLFSPNESAQYREPDNACIVSDVSTAIPASHINIQVISQNVTEVQEEHTVTQQSAEVGFGVINFVINEQ